MGDDREHGDCELEEDSDERPDLRLCPDECGSLCIPAWVEDLGGEWTGNPFIKRIMFEDGSKLRKIHYTEFENCGNLMWVVIVASVEETEGFNHCTGLVCVQFEVGSCLRTLGGFQECTSLMRVEVPASIETITADVFYDCLLLTDIVFASNSHLKVIHGFAQCSSLRRVELPASLEIIGGLLD
jgi:hypothetical protein